MNGVFIESDARETSVAHPGQEPADGRCNRSQRSLTAELKSTNASDGGITLGAKNL
jgi:hypothetical protein